MQTLTDNGLQALSCLASLRELSLAGALHISGKGLASLKDLPQLQVNTQNLNLALHTNIDTKSIATMRMHSRTLWPALLVLT